MSQSLFTQSVIAVIWDFDKTLSPKYMQEPLFRRFGVDEKTFWKEANGLAEFTDAAVCTTFPATRRTSTIS